MPLNSSVTDVFEHCLKRCFQNPNLHRTMLPASTRHARRPLVDRRVTQASQELSARTCPSSRLVVYVSSLTGERDSQTPGSLSNAGNAQAQGNQGGLFFR